jgi:hypothetical protein
MSGGGAASRRKGLAGEREVAQAFEAAGWECRGLEGSGDWLVFRHAPLDLNGHGPRPLTAHIEAKRQERWRLQEWIDQAAAEAPPGVPWAVTFRRNRGPWLACLELSEMLRLIG